MSPYKIEINYIDNDIYEIKILTKYNRTMICKNVKKEEIPDTLAKYLCVGNYKV